MKPVHFLPALFCLLFCLFTAQTTPNELLKKADSLSKIQNLTDALPALAEAEKLFLDQKDWDGFSKAVGKRCLLLNDLDSFSQSHLLLERALETLKNQAADSVLSPTAWLWAMRARTFRREENFSKTLESYQKALAIYEKNNVLGDGPAMCYKNVAQVFLRRLDYSEALKCLSAAQRVDTAQTYFYSILYNRSSCHLFLEQFDDVLAIAEKGLSGKPSPFYRAALLASAGSAMIAKKDFSGAQRQLDQALLFFEKSPDDQEACKEIYDELAILAEKQGQNARADALFAKTIKFCDQIYGPQKHREKAKTFVKWADFLAKTDQKDRAIGLYQKAIAQIFPNFSSPDPLQNPPAEAAYAESFGMTAPARKATLLLEKAQKTTDLTAKKRFLQAAAEAFDLAFGCIARLREGYGDEAAKLYMGDYAHDYLEKALETRSLLFDASGTEKSEIQNPKSEIAEGFFRLLEANRAVVLGEAIRKNRSLETVGLPDSLREREADFRRRLADFQSENLAAATDSARVVWNEKMADLEREQRLFLENLDQKWPEFKRLRETPNVPTLAKMQAKLGPDAAFLSFFEGGESLFIFALEAGKPPAIRRFSLDSIQKDLAEFTRFFAEKSRIDAAPARFFELSNRLFQRLVPLEKLPSRLVVMPDGAVGFVPFDALLTEKYSQTGFANAPFLVKKTAIEQAWSASIWAAPFSKKESSSNSRLQFAPLFDGRQRGLLPLGFSQNETEKADFETILGEKASASTFFELTKKPLAALHLSTHATATGEPRLEFFDRSASLAEIYGASIPADLVVLSACETGIGQREKSEGLLSLSRAFAYAGARSLVASLWSVNERSTARLFSLFYEKLGDEKSTPSAALRSAKMAFLADETALDAQKSPYFWAGFVPMGEQFSIRKPAAHGLFWLLGASFLAVVCAIFWRSKQSKKRF